jgi:heme-degrading monooxygenase HmoA
MIINRGGIMFYEVSALRVQDYEKWKRGFDGLVSILKENGAKCRRIFRDLEDPDKVMVIVEWENPEKAKKLANDKEMMAKFLKLGILELDIHHFEEIENKKL